MTTNHREHSYQAHQFVVSPLVGTKSQTIHKRLQTRQTEYEINPDNESPSLDKITYLGCELRHHHRQSRRCEQQQTPTVQRFVDSNRSRTAPPQSSIDIEETRTEPITKPWYYIYQPSNQFRRMFVIQIQLVHGPTHHSHGRV